MASITYTPYQTAEDYLKKAQEEAIAERRAQEQAQALTLDTQAQRTQDDAAQHAAMLYQNLLTQQRGAVNPLQSRGLYGSGYAETTLAGMQNQYSGDLAQSDLARQQTLQDIELARQQYGLQAQADIAGINQGYAQQYASLLQQREAQQRQAEQLVLDNAYRAAQHGDFSQLKALGVDTTSAERQYAMQLQAQAAQLQAARQTAAPKPQIDVFQAERGMQAGRNAADVFQKRGYNAADVLEQLELQRERYIKNYGQDYWDAYSGYIMSNYPGMSGYTPQEKQQEKQTEFFLKAKDVFDMLKTEILESDRITTLDDIKSYLRHFAISAEEKAQIANAVAVFLPPKPVTNTQTTGRTNMPRAEAK